MRFGEIRTFKFNEAFLPLRPTKCNLRVVVPIVGVTILLHPTMLIGLELSMSCCMPKFCNCLMKFSEIVEVPAPESSRIVALSFLPEEWLVLPTRACT